MSKLRLILLISCGLFLSSCSEPKPDGYVYTVNGMGLTLPSPDLEITFLPYNSRAEFFHGPITEAYTYATMGLDEALEPLCSEANDVIVSKTNDLDLARKELQKAGNVPKSADACMNMCSSRISLEDLRETDRSVLNQKLAKIDQQIASAKQTKEGLQASRSKKSGKLGKRLSQLKKERVQLIDKKANQLSESEVEKLSIIVGKRGAGRYGTRGQTVSIDLLNNTEFALRSASYGETFMAEGYYKGIKIADYSIRYPGYEVKNKTDSLGFDKRYMAKPGESFELGKGSIYNHVDGLSLNSPSGRLLAQERGWESNSAGYVLPDEIRIISFPISSFVIPDEKGKRQDSSIVYSPTVVDFREQATARGLPQDIEITKISKQMKNQSFSEDDQITTLNSEITQLRADQKSAGEAFNSSSLAKNISTLVESESACRAAGVAMNAIDERANFLVNQKGNLSSCGTEILNPGAIYSAVNTLNYNYGAELELPEIQEKYAGKARQLVWAKLVAEAQYISKTNINGAFKIDGSVDQMKSLVFAPVVSLVGERFWMQPLSSLGVNKNLNHELLSEQRFDEYVDDVIRSGCKECSLEEYSLMMKESDLSASNSNNLAELFYEAEQTYAGLLARIEATDLETDRSGVVPVTVAPVQACEI